MMLGKFQMGTVFPHESNLASWMVTVAMMLNDVVLATSSLEKNLDDNQSTKIGERLYWFRLASSHYREAIKFLAETHTKPYVAQFVFELSAEVQEAYKMIVGNSSKPDDSTLFGKDVVSTRNITFHYPYGSDVKKALEKMAVRESSIAFNGSLVKEFRALFADEVLLEIMDYNEETWRSNIKELGVWTGALIKFCNSAVSAYLEKYIHQISVE